jgi:hypothetical protein
MESKNNQKIYPSVFLFEENYKTLPPINDKINERRKEIKSELINLKDEKTFINNNIRNKNLSLKLFSSYLNNKIINKNINQSPSKRKSIIKDKNKKTITSSFREDSLKLKIKKLKMKLSEREKKQNINNLKNRINLSFEKKNINVNKNQMMNELKEIDLNTSFINEILLEQLSNNDEDVFTKIKLKLKSDEKKRMMTEEDLQPEKVKPFDITIKKQKFLSNLYNIIGKLNENSNVTGMIFNRIKSKNIKDHNYFKRLKEIEIQERGFKRFEDEVSYGDFLKKMFDKNYEKIQKKNMKENKI